MQETVLDELSDEDEIPIEVIKKIQQRKETKQLPAKPQPVKTKELPPPEPVKVKKEKIDRRRKGNHERTEAQKKAFEAVKAKRDAIRKERIEKRTAEEQQLKEELKKK